MNPQQLLMDTFNFSTHDLDCNQRGEQSEVQRDMIRREVCQLWLIINGFFLLVVVMLVMGEAGWGGILGIPAFWVIGVTLIMFLYLRDMSVIHAVTGTIQLEIKPETAYVSPDYEDITSPYFRVIVGDERLQLSPVAYHTLEKTLVGAQCTVYYRKGARRRRDILTIELINPSS